MTNDAHNYPAPFHFTRHLCPLTVARLAPPTLPPLLSLVLIAAALHYPALPLFPPPHVPAKRLLQRTLLQLSMLLSKGIVLLAGCCRPRASEDGCADSADRSAQAAA